MRGKPPKRKSLNHGENVVPRSRIETTIAAATTLPLPTPIWAAQ
jgi:hypothetical protein